jgi:hypothetical protein
MLQSLSLKQVAILFVLILLQKLIDASMCKMKSALSTRRDHGVHAFAVLTA